MRIWALFFGVLLSGLLAQSPPPSRGLKAAGLTGVADTFRTGKAYALIIATDDYDDKGWPHLQNPVNDARAIATELKAHYGYEEPDLLLNATVDEAYAKLSGYVHRKFEPADSLFVFIAGHGRFDEIYNRGYLVFKDSKLNDFTNRSYLPHSDLSNAVDAIPIRRIMLVIDACFGGTFENQIASRGAAELNYPEASKAEIVQRKSTLVTRLFLTSGGKEYVPDGRPGAHSPFAAQVLRALRTYGGDSGLVTSLDLFQQVDNVTANNPQYGWFGKADPGSDFWFATNRAVSTIPASDSELKGQSANRTRVNPIDGQTYVLIPVGDFRMGCSPGDTDCWADEKPSLPARIANPFWLGQTEVTQAAWMTVTGGDNPSHFKGDHLPVERVDWNQATRFCEAIGGRLPTEKEWEYAARAGNSEARYGKLDSIAWYAENSLGKTHPVALKQPNAFGLYDMLGNVWEWTSDNFDPTRKVDRGGSWYEESVRIRASERARDEPTARDDNVGLRCVWK